MCARDSLGRLFALGEGIRLVGEAADCQQFGEDSRFLVEDGLGTGIVWAECAQTICACSTVGERQHGWEGHGSQG